MKLLAVETSAVSASCCVTEDGRMLSQAAVNARLTHSQTLMPMIDSVLRCAALTFDDIDRCAVAVGPGSFTGIRIGVAAVKGLAFPRSLPCAAVSTLEAMAAMTCGLPFDGLTCPVMDARCQQVYTALFDHTGGQVKRLCPDSALPITELETRLLLRDRPVYLLGDGAELVYNALRGRVPALTLAPPALRYQNAVGVAAAAEQLDEKEWMKPDRLAPVYLRPPQAERELKARAAAGGNA